MTIKRQQQQRCISKLRTVKKPTTKAKSKQEQWYFVVFIVREYYVL
jgi:hypothetical protein